MSSEGQHDYSLGAGEVLRTTDKAMHVRTEYADDVWIPRTVIHEYSDLPADAEKGDTSDDVCVMVWWAEKQGWV